MADTSQYTDSAQPEKPEHPPLTAERVRAVLKYDAESGDFSWLSGRGMSSPGRQAGSVNGRGYGPQSFSTWKPIGDLARRLVEKAVGRE